MFTLLEEITHVIKTLNVVAMKVVCHLPASETGSLKLFSLHRLTPRPVDANQRQMHFIRSYTEQI